MGYNIHIGEATVRTIDDDVGDPEEFDRSELTGHQCAVEVARLELPEAPAFEGDVNPRCNYRWPSYSAWADFAEFVGLNDYFYDEDRGVFCEHSGCVYLTKHDVEIIDIAVANYVAEYPKAKPVFDNSAPNYQYARLLWLQWWVRWSVENCKVPAIYNS